MTKALEPRTPTLAAQIEALAPCPNPWCIAKSPPLLAGTRHGQWAVLCECGIRSWYKPTEAEAIAAWNTRPAIITALGQAGAAPEVVDPIIRWIDQAIERAKRSGNTEGIWLFGSQWTTVRDALAPARQHGAREPWQPIESAPKNKAVQVHIPGADYYGNEGVYAAMLVDMGTDRRWMTFGWAVGRDCSADAQPTAWRYLPAAPATDVGEG